MTPNPNKMRDGVAPEAEPRFEKLVAPQAGPCNFKPCYENLVFFSYCHIAGLYGLYLCFTEACWTTLFLACVLRTAAMLGITAGAHRLWSHRAYKARTPLQIILMLFHCLACQTSVVHWATDHRLHHKYTDTDADPHNATRGFFFSHMGWLFVQKNPEAQSRRRVLNISDLLNNPVLKFQKRFILPIGGLVCFVLPTIAPMYFWGESLKCAWHVNILRLVVNWHFTFLVNSAAHAFGNKPYDKFITPTQSVSVSIASLGEGYHNYHHVFPWDYRAAELGNNALNFTTQFIDFFTWIGWAYELKTASNADISRRIEKTGDGTNLWGWGDKDLPKEVVEETEVLYAQEQIQPLREKNRTQAVFRGKDLSME